MAYRLMRGCWPDRNEVLYLVLRSAAWLLPIFPVSAAYTLAALAGRLAFHAVPGARQAICENLSVVLGEPPQSGAVRRAALAAFQNDAKNWVDTLRIGQLSTEEILETIKVDGLRHLDEALAEGKGVILVTLHLGNYDLVGQALAARGLDVTIPVEHIRPAKLFDFLVRQRASQGIRVVPVEQAPRTLLRALRQGQIVAVAGDRAIAGQVEWVEFFGRLAPLPSGPVSLARRTGAPVVLGVGIRTRGSHFQGFVSPPLDLAALSDRGTQGRENTQRLARAYEPYIRRFANQWMVFARVWPREMPAGIELSMALEREAAV